jgi:hypothetical protein
MRDFTRSGCGQHLAFENSVCLSCGSRLGYSFDQATLLVTADSDSHLRSGSVDGRAYRLCANLDIAECNWLVGAGSAKTRGGELCASRGLTRTRSP